MAFDSAKTSLAFIEEKFQKLFGLAGKIGATFTPNMAPVVVTADLNDPGTATFRGRHWCWVSDLFTLGAANTTIGIRAGVPVLIEAMMVSASPVDGGGGGATTRLPIHILAPSIAVGANPFAAMTRNAGTWTDQKMIESDLPPIFDGGGPLANGAAAFAQLSIMNRIWQTGYSGGSIIGSIQVTPPGWRGAHLPANGEIRAATQYLGIGTQLSLGIYGRIA